VSEAEQVELARQGDMQAWEALVNAHQPTVFRLAYLILGDPDEAEDVTQEAFVRAFFSLARFDTQRPFRPWLVTIASNLARNQQRSLSRYWAAIQRWVNYQPHPGVQPDIAGDHLGSQELWAAVRLLGPDDQALIYLRFFLEMSEAETAQSLGLPVGTVKSRQHRALARLRKIMD
jgi:RNA polymerase sigma-70 factor (ECF subfamily)